MGVRTAEREVAKLRKEYYHFQKAKISSFPAFTTPDPTPKEKAYLTPRIFSREIIAGLDLRTPSSPKFETNGALLPRNHPLPNPPQRNNNPPARAEEHRDARYPAGDRGAMQEKAMEQRQRRDRFARAQAYFHAREDDGWP